MPLLQAQIQDMYDHWVNNHPGKLTNSWGSAGGVQPFLLKIVSCLCNGQRGHICYVTEDTDLSGSQVNIFEHQIGIKSNPDTLEKKVGNEQKAPFKGQVEASR